MAKKHKKKSKFKVPVNRAWRTASGRRTKYYRPYKKRKKSEKARKINNYFVFRGYLSSWLHETGTDWRIHGSFGGVSSRLWKSLLPEQKQNLKYLKNNIDNIWLDVYGADIKELAKSLSKYMILNYDTLNWWLTKDMVEDICLREDYRNGGGSFTFFDEEGEVIPNVYTVDNYKRLLWLKMVNEINKLQIFDSSPIIYIFDSVDIVDNKLIIKGRFSNYLFLGKKIEIEKKEVEEKIKPIEKEKPEEEKEVIPISEVVKLKELEIELEKEKQKRLALEIKKGELILEMLKAGFTKNEITKLLG